VIPGLALDDAIAMIAPESGLDAGAAYDNLTQVMRADLLDPLKEAHSAFELARRGDGAHETDAVTDSVAELVLVLDRLVDLDELRGSDALLAGERIELWPMLQSVWAEVEPIAISRSVKVRFRTLGDAASLATMYGGETWLRRVFLECLESAVRAERPGGTLEIEHRQLGPRSVIVFRDCGVFGSRAASGIGHRAQEPGQAQSCRAKPQRARPGRAQAVPGHRRIARRPVARRARGWPEPLRDRSADGGAASLRGVKARHRAGAALCQDLAALMAHARHCAGETR